MTTPFIEIPESQAQTLINKHWSPGRLPAGYSWYAFEGDPPGPEQRDFDVCFVFYEQTGDVLGVAGVLVERPLIQMRLF